jgi:hypothetical protein
VSEDELQVVMHIFQKDKSPGLDGWMIEFFLGFYDLLGVDILKVVEESRSGGFMYPSFNSTFISLIPKSDYPISMNDFRSISLYNYINKIIAKIIARGSRRSYQPPFLKRNLVCLKEDRSMKSIGVAQKTLHNLKIKNGKGVVLKIDLSKDYDKVNWIYIRLLLTHVGFEVPFISCIMSCISIVSFFILINGATSPFFHSERGFRQGCTLSPLLFMLIV